MNLSYRRRGIHARDTHQSHKNQSHRPNQRHRRNRHHNRDRRPRRRHKHNPARPLTTATTARSPLPTINPTNSAARQLIKPTHDTFRGQFQTCSYFTNNYSYFVSWRDGNERSKLYFKHFSRIVGLVKATPWNLTCKTFHPRTFQLRYDFTSGSRTRKDFTKF